MVGRARDAVRAALHDYRPCLCRGNAPRARLLGQSLVDREPFSDFSSTARRSELQRGLVDALRDFRPGSLLILDEAHHAAPASARKYAIDSQITKAIRDLAPKFEHRLFLTATPHNGHPLRLDLDAPEERRQRELDIRAWRGRLSNIGREIEEQPARIVAGYEIRAERLEPVGIIYLWPATG